MSVQEILVGVRDRVLHRWVVIRDFVRLRCAEGGAVRWFGHARSCPGAAGDAVRLWRIQIAISSKRNRLVASPTAGRSAST
jgi:hypothetical protein